MISRARDFLRESEYSSVADLKKPKVEGHEDLAKICFEIEQKSKDRVNQSHKILPIDIVLSVKEQTLHTLPHFDDLNCSGLQDLSKMISLLPLSHILALRHNCWYFWKNQKKQKNDQVDYWKALVIVCQYHLQTQKTKQFDQEMKIFRNELAWILKGCTAEQLPRIKEKIQKKASQFDESSVSILELLCIKSAKLVLLHYFNLAVRHFPFRAPEKRCRVTKMASEGSDPPLNPSVKLQPKTEFEFVRDQNVTKYAKLEQAYSYVHLPDLSTPKITIRGHRVQVDYRSLKPSTNSPQFHFDSENLLTFHDPSGTYRDVTVKLEREKEVDHSRLKSLWHDGFLNLEVNYKHQDLSLYQHPFRVGNERSWSNSKRNDNP